MMFGRSSAQEKPTSGSGLYEAFENNLMGRTSLNSMGSGGSYDEYREAAGRVAAKAAEKASAAKAVAMDWFSQFTQQ